MSAMVAICSIVKIVLVDVTCLSFSRIVGGIKHFPSNRSADFVGTDVCGLGKKKRKERKIRSGLLLPQWAPTSDFVPAEKKETKRTEITGDIDPHSPNEWRNVANDPTVRVHSIWDRSPNQLEWSKSGSNNCTWFYQVFNGHINSLITLLLRRATNVQLYSALYLYGFYYIGCPLGIDKGTGLLESVGHSFELGFISILAWL